MKRIMIFNTSVFSFVFKGADDSRDGCFGKESGGATGFIVGFFTGVECEEVSGKEAVGGTTEGPSCSV